MAVRYVEYIESNGTQYIDTGFKPNQDTRVVMEVIHNSTAIEYLFSAATSSPVFGVSYVSGYYNEYGSKSHKFSTASPSGTKTTIDLNKNVCTIGGETITAPTETFSCAGTIYLFCAYGGSYRANYQLYSCKIYDNGTLVRDFRPALDSDGVACLYDKVGKEYVYNSGTGTFAAGAEIAVPAVDFGTVCRMPLRIGETKIDYADNFADNDWATIAKVCAAGLVPDSWKDDGTSYKDMTIGGNAYRVVIVGKEHDEFEDGKKAPFTFQLYNSYKTTYAMNSSNTNVGGWEQAALRNTHLPVILAAMPSEVQAAIKLVKKLTSAGNLSTNIVTTLDKLFVPSEVEVFGHNNNSIAGEGTQYEYYKKGGSKVKTANGSANSWQERSPSKSSSGIFCCVGSTGSATTGNASAARGVSPMFCFGNKVGGSGGGGTQYAVNVSGAGDDNLYISINNTKITSAGTYTINAGDTIYCYGKPAGNVSTTRIVLDGTIIKGAMSGEVLEYTFAPAGNCSIDLTYYATGVALITITTE